MADAAHGPPPTGRPFPDGVPILLDLTAGVTLRAHDDADIDAIVEQCHDCTPPSGAGR